MIAAYERLAAFIDKRVLRLPASEGRHAALVARQEARSMASYVRMQTAADARSTAEGRDEGMAANVRFLAEELYPGQRIIVWGHNYHVSHAAENVEPRADVFPGVPARAMGSWVRKWFGRAVYTNRDLSVRRPRG